MAGEIVAGDTRVEKAGQPLREDVALRVKGRRTYVSRGGHKLASALDHFGIDPARWCCLDLGASTGGFTDALLRRGAEKVYAVDVGYGQLAWSLRQDPRVIVLDRTRAEDIDAVRVPDEVDLIVTDVSFTSLGRVLPAPRERIKPGGAALLLIKPQFEAPRGAVGAGGVVRDDAVRIAARDAAARDVEALGFEVVGIVPSAIRGARGNIEYLLYALDRSTRRR